MVGAGWTIVSSRSHHRLLHCTAWRPVDFFFLFCLIGTSVAQPATEPGATMDLLVVDRDSGTPIDKAKIDVHRTSSDSKMETGSAYRARSRCRCRRRANGYFYVEIQQSMDTSTSWIEWREGDKDPIPGAYTLEDGTWNADWCGKVVDDQGVAHRGGGGGDYGAAQSNAADGNYMRMSGSIFLMRMPNRVTMERGRMPGAPAEFVDSVELGAWDYHHASGDFYQFKKFSAAQARDGSIALVIPRGVPIEGVVTGADDKPLAGASVNYGGDMASNKMPLQKTDSEGKFEYRGQAGGDRVVLTVEAKGYAPELTSFTMGEEKKEVSIPLSASKPMFGRILGPDEEPIPNAWVYPDTWRGFLLGLETRIRRGWAMGKSQLERCAAG